MFYFFHFFTECVVCLFGHEKDLQSYKSQSPLQRKIFSKKKIPFQELQRTVWLDYKMVILYL